MVILTIAVPIIGIAMTMVIGILTGQVFKSLVIDWTFGTANAN